MKAKERILNSLKGIDTDRLPWSPNVAYWWPMQGENITSMGEVEFLESIKADPLIRGHYPMKDKKMGSFVPFQ